jgi:hypothetical protein
VTTLALSRLGRADAGAIADQVAGGRELPAELLNAIVGRTDGVPLFVEELTKAVLEMGLLRAEVDRYVLQGPLPPLAIPDTLQGSLLARLDRLAPVKEVAQVGAVIGREFSHALLDAVADTEGDRLTEALNQLVGAGLVFQHGSPAEPFYAFKHALVQEAAYQSLLKSRRQQLQTRVADALEAGHDGESNASPEVLAHHLTEAGLLARALPAWLAAGEWAWRRSAYKEAIAHLRRGLEVAAGVPGPEGRRAEIRLHILLGVTLTVAHGPWPDAAEAYDRAGRLAAETGETGELLRALWGSWSAAISAATYSERGRSRPTCWAGPAARAMTAWCFRRTTPRGPPPGRRAICGRHESTPRSAFGFTTKPGTTSSRRSTAGTTPAPAAGTPSASRSGYRAAWTRPRPAPRRAWRSPAGWRTRSRSVSP